MVFIGDFNDVIAQHEKVGLHPKPTSQVKAFRCFVDKNALMDLELQGSKYTWFSNPRNGFVTKERIDRNLFKASDNLAMSECIGKIPIRVTDNMNRELMKEVPDQEIKEATFSLGSPKAPGPDGLNGLFFQKHWAIIEKEVCEAVKSFFQEGILPSSIGDTIIVLVPKVNYPETLNQLRPISCCNFIYKIVSKVLVIRLRRLIDTIISPIQSAFVGGCLIQNNMVIVQEMFHALNKRGQQASRNLAVKIDMNKAYNRVEWSFLEATLKAFRFNPHWVKMIMSCVLQVTYRIKINGILSKSFVPQRGLRQGDPLTPYLFIIAAEVFTILMDKATEEGRISGVRIAPTAPAISHILFADDCIIFSKDSAEEIYHLITTINMYTEVSGQRINVDKSGITFGNQIPIRNRVEIEEILGLPAWDKPGKYLGLPAQWGRSKNEALRWIEERVSDKLRGWKEKLLSQSGREVLIKSVIQVIPAYAMNVVLFPKGFCHRLSKKVAKFWWASTGKDRGIYWRIWDKICASKREGGIGFKDFYSQNIAHLAKQAWRMFECPNAVWVQVLKAVYFPNEDFKVTKAGRGASWIWKSIVQEKVRIQEDNWILNKQKSPQVMNHAVTFVKELITEGQGWNINELRKHFDGGIIGKIIRTPVSVISREDKFSWPFKTDGKYTVKTGYHVARREQSIGNSNSPLTSDDFKDLWRDIWNLKEPESTEHALLLCPWTRAAWFGAQVQCCPTAHTVSSFGKWIMDLFKNMKACTGTDYELCISKVGFLAWEVWKARNHAVHQRSKPNPLLVIYKAKQIETEFAEMAEEPAKSFVNDRRTVRRVTWRPPLPGWIKCNVDAAFLAALSGGATAAVFRDYAGNLLTASNFKIAATSPLVAEALAVRVALIIAKNFQLKRIIFESDSLILIQALKSKASIAEIQVILDDILDLARHISNCGFTWVPRDGNALVHEVAKLSADGSLQQDWLRCKPQTITNILKRENDMSLQMVEILRYFGYAFWDFHPGETWVRMHPKVMWPRRLVFLMWVSCGYSFGNLSRSQLELLSAGGCSRRRPCCGFGWKSSVVCFIFKHIFHPGEYHQTLREEPLIYKELIHTTLRTLKTQDISFCWPSDVARHRGFDIPSGLSQFLVAQQFMHLLVFGIMFSR
ncbi:uncharacterized protein [Arachis hypogaea]|uniref:uncharacterized protein n=1 Tax=Arachis hypogaea TaxID=3818 RepID=UPI003B21B944